ncbi:MAG: serine/threonine-protein kinase PknK, partial [Myxococcales bacterium]|nr:serine/threonine-protein kinase PknK [Myxococcales bacterium]
MVVPLGPFDLIRPRGTGAMATVWEAVHREQGTRVAVKVMTGAVSELPGFQARFAHEVRAVARLDHPGIVRLYDHGEVPPEVAFLTRGALQRGSPFLVMEWLDGGSLRSRIGLAAWPELRATLLSLLAALSHAHARDLVHRDLKPDNVLQSARGPVLTDFGVAFAGDLDVKAQGEHTMVGTANYMAPEQVRGDFRAFGPWTDLYALGCLAYALASGRAPFSGRPFMSIIGAHLDEAPPELVPRMPVPEGFAEWLQRLTAKAPSERFRLAADAAVALLALPDPPPGEVLPLPVEAPGEPEETLLEAPVFVPVTEVAWHAGPLVGDRPPVPTDWREPERQATAAPLLGVGRALFGLKAPPMVGREAERDVLWGLLREVAAGGGVRVVIIEGPSGHGKTHLIDWLSRRAHELGVALTLRATHDNPGGPSCGLRGLLERAFRCTGLDATARAARIRAALTGLDADGQLARALAAAIDPLGQLDEGGARVTVRSGGERYEAMCHLLDRLGARRPRIVAADDVQWGIDALYACEHVLRRWSKLPALITLTVRDDLLRRIRRFVPGRDAVMKFRHQNVLQRVLTYERYWDRIVRAIEEGTYERDRFKADYRAKAKTDTAAASPEETVESKARVSAVADEAEAFLAQLGGGAKAPVAMRGRPVGEAPVIALRGAPVVARPSTPGQGRTAA